MAPYHILLYLL